MRCSSLISLISFLLTCVTVTADRGVIRLYDVSNLGGEVVGEIDVVDGGKGMVLTSSIPVNSVITTAGLKATILHDTTACEGVANTPHYDNGDNQHGDFISGHLGDLPQLTFSSDGSSEDEVVANRMKVFYLQDRALVVYGSQDTEQPNFSGVPALCGVMEEFVSKGVTASVGCVTVAVIAMWGVTGI
eukprot:GHVN01027398.1.p1 GENE.GHVN01027398.1~~GHVN01027398.1.p1  ORF type:complete len:202 (+),score=31.40 GHVN01027398.1:43-606(+)